MRITLFSSLFGTLCQPHYDKLFPLLLSKVAFDSEL